MSTEPALTDERIHDLRIKYRDGIQRADPCIGVVKFSEVLAMAEELTSLRALPRERECICDDHQGTHMRCPQHGTDYIDHDAVVREPAVRELIEGNCGLRRLLSELHTAKLGQYSRDLDRAIAALSPQAALSTDTSTDTSRKRGEDDEVCDVVGCLEPAERLMYLNAVRARLCVGHEKQKAAEVSAPAAAAKGGS